MHNATASVGWVFLPVRLFCRHEIASTRLKWLQAWRDSRPAAKNGQKLTDSPYQPIDKSDKHRLWIAVHQHTRWHGSHVYAHRPLTHSGKKKFTPRRENAGCENVYWFLTQTVGRFQQWWFLTTPTTYRRSTGRLAHHDQMQRPASVRLAFVLNISYFQRSIKRQKGRQSLFK